MLTITDGIVLVPTGRNAKVRAEIAETLAAMESGKGFEITGDVKNGTVRAVAKEMNIQVRIAAGVDGKIWCVKK